MDNKLSELSKPVAWVKADRNLAENWSCTDPEAVTSTEGWHSDYNPTYSQEYVSALLAELEAVKAENALFRETGDYLIQAAYCAQERATAAEKRLATPVRLSDSTVMSRRHVVDAIRAAGFTVEGDE